MEIVNAKPGSSVYLGRQGENLARKIVFYIGPWIEIYGNGVVQLLHQRKGDQDPYPVVVQQDGNEIFWLVSEVDTNQDGVGRYELHFYAGDSLVKSATGDTLVRSAMVSSVAPPDPQKGWVEQVLQIGAISENAANEARNSAAAAKESADSIPQTVKNALKDAKESGEFDGADGFSPTVQVQTIPGGHKVTVTDKGGPKSFDVMDGKDGDGSGGGVKEVFTVNAVEDDGFSPPRYSADKTSQEIYEAWMADKIIVCKYLMSGFPVELQPLLITDDTVVFSALAILRIPNDPLSIDVSGYVALVIRGEKVDVQYTKVELDGATPEHIEEAVNKYLDEHPIEGGVSFETGETLTLKDGILSVNTTDQMEQDNTLPITSAGVYATVGNIEALLKTI